MKLKPVSIHKIKKCDIHQFLMLMRLIISSWLTENCRLGVREMRINWTSHVRGAGGKPDKRSAIRLGAARCRIAASPYPADADSMLLGRALNAVKRLLIGRAIVLIQRPRGALHRGFVVF